MTANERNAAISEYITATFVHENDALGKAKKSSLQKGIPDISVPKAVGKLLYMLSLLQKPKRILEIGTLTGYSTLWLAQGAPDAEIITIEFDPKHAEIARSNFKRSSSKIHLLEGDAADLLTDMITTKVEPFDLIFLDADKDSYPTYLPLIIALSRPGTLLLSDNLIPREAEINSPKSTDVQATGVYAYNTLLALHSRLETILVPTIVEKWGRLDALGISIVLPFKQETKSVQKDSQGL
ncbi:MAG: putative O-methyltransferase [Chlamydiia bacterium]|nr:putative O-methyltransferase [Chlamydiia bacterium]